MTRRVSLILILFIGFICLRQPVNGDKDLIDKVCGWTIWPDACQKCLSDETDKDEKDLGIISIRCSYTQSMIIIHDFDVIADSTGDAAVKLLCDQGKQIIGEAISSIHQATIDCNDGNFDGAADHMKDAGYSYEACALIAQKIPAPPGNFSDDLSLLMKDYVVSEGIMVKLSTSVI